MVSITSPVRPSSTRICTWPTALRSRPVGRPQGERVAGVVEEVDRARLGAHALGDHLDDAIERLLQVLRLADQGADALEQPQPVRNAASGSRFTGSTARPALGGSFTREAGPDDIERTIPCPGGKVQSFSPERGRRFSPFVSNRGSHARQGASRRTAAPRRDRGPAGDSMHKGKANGRGTCDVVECSGVGRTEQEQAARPARRPFRALLFVLLLTLGAAVATAGIILFQEFNTSLPPVKDLAHYRPPTTSRVYAADGTLLGEFYLEKRYLVPIYKIPRVVQLAFVAAEDSDFYEHEGIDPISIVRAAFDNYRSGHVARAAARSRSRSSSRCCCRRRRATSASSRSSSWRCASSTSSPRKRSSIST